MALPNRFKDLLKNIKPTFLANLIATNIPQTLPAGEIL